jgi:hypothetical protein
LAFSDNGNMIAIAGRNWDNKGGNSHVRIINIETKSCVSLYDSRKDIGDGNLYFIDNKFLFIATGSTLTIWDIL